MGAWSSFFYEHGIISQHQYGFLEGKSYLSKLLVTFEEWTRTLGPKSEWAPCSQQWISQGSVNVIPDLVYCKIKMFADDTELYSMNRNQEDHYRLQPGWHNTVDDWKVVATLQPREMQANASVETAAHNSYHDKRDGRESEPPKNQLSKKGSGCGWATAV